MEEVHSNSAHQHHSHPVQTMNRTIDQRTTSAEILTNSGV